MTIQVILSRRAVRDGLLRRLAADVDALRAEVEAIYNDPRTMTRDGREFQLKTLTLDDGRVAVLTCTFLPPVIVRSIVVHD